MTFQRETSYDVRIWKTETYSGATVSTYKVRWRVGKERFKQGFRTAALAESFRSTLMRAAREGEAFDVATGQPVSVLRNTANGVSWYEFACSYVDMKWPNASPKHRKSISECLVTITVSMLIQAPIRTDSKSTRVALRNWGFNAKLRGSDGQPSGVTERLIWVAMNSRSVVDLTNPDVLRSVLDSLTVKLDGKRAAGRTASLKRTILSNALDHAVERRIIGENPLNGIKWSVPKSASKAIDRQVVVNPDQARGLLAAVKDTPRNGPKLVAFFASMYYAALRPEEAVCLRKSNLLLPEDPKEYGWLVLDRAAPENGRSWSDSGDRRDARQLKHRALGDTRTTPCPPALGRLIRKHLEDFGTDADGYLFFSERGGFLSSGSYTKLWGRARKLAFTAEQLESPLARRPYDLRHAAVSTWLAGGIPPTQVAEWAGHSVKVLLDVYAKCLDGQEELALKRMAEALGDIDDQPEI